MKFSCPTCSAKYQIADEKVAGRTVKMKCRKCDTVIPIRAEPSRQSLAAAPMVHAHSLKPSPLHAPAPVGVKLTGLAPGPPTIPAPLPVAIWHAGIDGSSVGPLTHAELESRVREGSVTAETYVWREGMAGWQPLPEVAELAGLLDSAPLLAAPPSIPAKAKVPAPRPVSPGSPRPAAVAPAPAAVAAAALPVTAAAPGPAAARVSADLEDDFFAAKKPADPKADVAPNSPRGIAALSPGSGPVASNPIINEAPFTVPGDAPIPDIAMPASFGGHASHQPSYESLIMQLRKRRKNPWVIPFAVLAALVFGVTIGFVLFGEQDTKIIRQVIEVPAKVGQAMEEKQKAKEIQQELVEVAGEVPVGTPAQKSGAAKTSTGTSPAPKAGPSEVTKGLSGLSGLSDMNGPSSGPSGAGDVQSSGQPLSASQIERTVSTYRASVKRGCWDKALMTRASNAPSSARVSVSISVSPSGSVTSANAGADPNGYPGLSSCIASRVRGWTFPRSSGSTTVNVPFVFAAQ